MCLPTTLEAVFQDKVPFYDGVNERKHKLWMSPERGLLAGEIKRILSVQKFQLKDLYGNDWEIDTSDTFWRGRLRPFQGLKIKLVGTMKGEGQFIANEIRPWHGRRIHGRMRRFKSKRKNQIERGYSIYIRRPHSPITLITIRFRRFPSNSA